MKEKILIVDDEKGLRHTFRVFLEDTGYQVETARNYQEAVELSESMEFDLAFVDTDLNGRSGIEVLKTIKKRQPECQVLIMTGVPAVETASEAIRFGAIDYIVKPVCREMLLRASTLALRHKAVADARERCRRNMGAIFRSVREGIISVDRNMAVLEMNEAAGRLCGIQCSDSCGRCFSDLPLKCGRGCLDILLQTLTKKETVESDALVCRSRHNPGQTVGLVATPMLDENSRFSGAVLVIRDRTHILDLENRLKSHMDFDHIVGRSEPILKVCDLVRQLANVRTSVLITGESGTGKEVVADALQIAGDRSDKPFVKVNCAALAENLLESELFGHVRGAFTGAVNDKAGRFERADGGTIFLDEIGEISAGMQLRFLRVLEKMEIERVGESSPIRIDVRVIAATNQDLRKRVRQGRFREDLFYRLNVVEIQMPPLRNRREDIPLLVNHFLSHFSRNFNRQMKGVSSAAMAILMQHSWPGNVRELKNSLEHAFVLSRNGEIAVEDLPANLTGTCDSFGAGISPGIEIIEEALKRTAGNKSRAAHLLGISRRTLYRKINQQNIETEIQ